LLFGLVGLVTIFRESKSCCVPDTVKQRNPTSVIAASRFVQHLLIIFEFLIPKESLEEWIITESEKSFAGSGSSICALYPFANRNTTKLTQYFPNEFFFSRPKVSFC